MIKSPYKFLDSYTKDDIDLYFGRENEVDEVYARLFYSNLLLIYGESGTGKTSILQCGISNKLGPSDWLPIFIRRSNNFLKALDYEINKLSGKIVNEALSIKLNNLYLDTLTPIYLIFDQFEELFIFGKEDERLDFATELKKLLDNNKNINVIISMRSEYLANLTVLEDIIPELFENRIYIEKMSRVNAKSVIEKPAEVVGIKIEEGLTNSIISLLSNETGTIDLTYLQVLLDFIYQESSTRDDVQAAFTFEDFHEFNNIGDILTKFLDSQLEKMKNRSVAEMVLKTMVSNDGTRRKQPISSIIAELRMDRLSIDAEDIQAILHEFVNVRIVSDKDEHGFFELRHDSIASRVFQRMSKLEKELIEVRMLLMNAYKSFEKRKVFLSNEDIQFIESYKDLIVFEKHLIQFINQSKTYRSKEKATIEKNTDYSRFTIITIIASSLPVLLIVLSLVGITHIEITNKANSLLGYGITYAILAFSIAFLFLSLIIIRNKSRWKIKKLEETLKERTSLLIERNEYLSVQNKNISDSILYAKKIQDAVLPSKESIETVLPSSFVILMPKDIVSGDFYWIYEKPKEVLFAAVDCTGHGVPGAFMSFIGYKELNHIAKIKNKPGDILDELDRLIFSSLNNQRESNVWGGRDAMDMALCRLNLDSLKLEFAGAYNPLFIIREKELIELKANRFAVGYKEPLHESFMTHTIQLQRNDMIFIFSDGFVDQFGGPKGKKFMYKRFKELLVANSEMEVQEQKNQLLKTFDEWKGDYEQVDDVLIIGVRI